MTIPDTRRWQLPDGIDELLPDAAWRVEALRRQLMDQCRAWGFDLVIPPMIEYLDSLLTGSGETTDLQTLKLVDQVSGRTLGVRADMTQQAARIDAHALRRDQPNRLFYTGTVLRAQTDGFGGSRSPQQFGAEIFGHAGLASDLEIIALMLATTELVVDSGLVLDLGHVGIYRALVSAAELDKDQESLLFAAVQRGSRPDVAAALASLSVPARASEHLLALMQMRGNGEILDKARAQFSDAGSAVGDALDALSGVVSDIRSTRPDMPIHIDLADLRGYRYHTGLLFSVYNSDGVQLARGGRYDAIGAAFGRSRAATGFSGDLKQLADLGGTTTTDTDSVFVPVDPSFELRQRVLDLRRSGRRLVQCLPGSGMTPESTGCNQQLAQVDGQWIIQDVT